MPCTAQAMDTMRGHQALLTCAATTAHKDKLAGRTSALAVQEEEEEGVVVSASGAYDASAPVANKRGCGLSVWADEAIPSEAI